MMDRESPTLGSVHRSAQPQPVGGWGAATKSWELGSIQHVSKIGTASNRNWWGCLASGKMRCESFSTIICVNQFPCFKSSRDRVTLCSSLSFVVPIICTPFAQKSQPKPTDWQITLWHLLLAHKMKTFFKCFPRCLNCTRKLIGSGTTPTSGRRTRFCCQRSFSPRWCSAFSFLLNTLTYSKGSISTPKMWLSLAYTHKKLFFFFCGGWGAWVPGPIRTLSSQQPERSC